MTQVTVLFPDSQDRDRATAVWIAALTLGMPLGPLLGGWLLGHF